MDGARFDLWTRRRFAAAGRGFVASLFGLPALEDAEAKKNKHKKKREKCKGNKKRCRKKCIPKSQCCGGCGARQCCDGRCTDLTTDAANCGACGNQCDAGKACFGGACLTAAGTCASVPDPCDRPVPTCNGGVPCACQVSMTGQTRCAIPPPAIPIICGNCTSDQQCIDQYGPGAFCSMCCGGLGGCAVPCTA